MTLSVVDAVDLVVDVNELEVVETVEMRESAMA